MKKGGLKIQEGGKYMKKLGIAMVIALIAIAVVAGPVLADGGEASVTCGEITVTDDSPVVGTIITFYGTVTVVANADSQTSWSCYPGSPYGAYAYAESSAWYRITAPDGTITYVEIAPSPKTEEDTGELKFYYYYWEWQADADAGYVYDWHADVYVDQVGEYLAEQGGSAYAYYGHYEQVKVYHGPYPWDWHWEEQFVIDGEFGPETSNCPGKEITSRSGVTAAASYIHPYLVINLPDGSRHFYGSNGWGNPTSQEIAYTDGTWQVEIQGGTAIQMDGSWHDTTYLDVDDQGNVTGRYGAGGSTVAEEIGLSQPITITKVG